MLVHEAKAVAARWVHEEAADTPGFCGAFYHGSTNWLPDDATLPPTSDLDVMVVFDAPEPAQKLGKFVHEGILLEVSSLARDELRSPGHVLGLSHLAGSFRAPGIIADPTGWLTALGAAVARDYARHRWVRARVAHAESKVLSNLGAVREDAPFHRQVTAWLFGTGVTTHMLLVAGLENPTVRRRYLATRDLLAAYGRLDVYPALLGLLGCVAMSQERAARHLDALEALFDAAKAVLRSPFPYAADLTDLARPVAIDGSRELIARGDHREAIFWIVATASRCQQVLANDASPDIQAHFEAPYRELLADLGITAFADLARRGAKVRAFLPRLRAEAEAIMAANPAIEA